MGSECVLRCVDFCSRGCARVNSATLPSVVNNTVMQRNMKEFVLGLTTYETNNEQYITKTTQA